MVNGCTVPVKPDFRRQKPVSVMSEQGNKGKIMQISLVPAKTYNRVDNVLKTLRNVHVEKGKTYTVEGLKHKERIYFDCIKSGWLKVRYRFDDGKDIFSFGGNAIMKVNQELTEGFDEVN